MAVGERPAAHRPPGVSGQHRGKPCCARAVARAIQLSACGASAVIVNPCDTRGILPGPQTQARPLCGAHGLCMRPAHACTPARRIYTPALSLRPAQRRPPECQGLWCTPAPCRHSSCNTHAVRLPAGPAGRAHDGQRVWQRRRPGGLVRRAGRLAATPRRLRRPAAANLLPPRAPLLSKCILCARARSQCMCSRCEGPASAFCFVCSV